MYWQRTEWQYVPRDNEGGPDYSISVCGDDIIGISDANSAHCQRIAEQLRTAGGWLESVAGIDSVVVRFDAATTNVDTARRRLERQLGSITTAAAADASLVDIPVCYGGEFGPDFGAVCDSLGFSAEQLIALHTAGEYTVEMLGFTPGFAYVGGLPDKLDVPRLEKPRQHVEAGSIGIAGGRSGLYAMAGPGGWPLIGRTPIRLFDAAAERPFLLQPGNRVRFSAIDAETFRERDTQ